MERDEAKAILELYRPGSSEDLQDPLIAEAFARLQTDTELKDWFEVQQAVDDQISRTYNSIKVPVDLKAGILAGMRAHASASTTKAESEGKSFTASSQSWWRNPWIGIAAVFAILLTLSTALRDNAPEFAETNSNTVQAGVPDLIQFLSDQMSNTNARGGFDKASEKPEALQAYLASVGAPSPAKLPSSLAGNSSLGCFTFDYEGAKISMICFRGDQVVHLLTLQKSECPRSFRPETPKIYEINNRAFKAWTDQGQVYILSTEGSKENLPKAI